ncbi:MAG: alpha/beta fold hydrolase [Phaeodactylibacter sp.]|uniref:alpha/beta fold hydrolase n=1 Tax=Phaeodactylibacter sp. TaxID=1940289 RepID=UPI0032EF23EC
MKKLFVLTFILIYLLPLLPAQNLLKPQWKFMTGDQSEWASPNFNDSEWRTLLHGKLWEKQGVSAYNGFAWYRQSVLVPEGLKAAARKNEGLVLELGKIDDADETFWNGKPVGATGQMPPNYKGAYDKQRTYIIPFEDIRFGAENLIAVRVYDHQGGGGIYKGVISLRVPGMKDLLSLQMEGLPEDHVFGSSQPVTFSIKMGNGFSEDLSGRLKVMVLSDFGAQILEETIRIDLKRGQQRTVPQELGVLPPGFYEVNLVFESQYDNKQVQFSLGVAPTAIQSPLDRPADFRNYWERARRELAAVAPQFQMYKIDSLSTPEKETYLVEMRSLGNILVRGWYHKPTAPGRHPAVLEVQGYSSSRTPEQGYQEGDIASFVLNIRGHGNSQDHIDPGFPGYLQHHIEDKELYIYRGAYMDCLRALDFIFSRPEVDTTRVAVMGGSQGGALSFATAALAPDRIALCAPSVPFLSDFRDYFKVGVWPASEFTQYVMEHPEVGWEKVYETLSYIDIKNLAPWVEAPVFMGVGLLDPTCPPHINFAAFNQLKVPKSYVIYPEAGHGLPSVHGERRMVWIKAHFGLE